MASARRSFKADGPRQVSAVAGWYRLTASDQSGGEWTPNIVDILNPGSPIVQTDVDRRAAVGTSANGLPTMVFDGTDVHLLPVSPTQIIRTTLGFLFWFKPASVAGLQMIYNLQNGVGGATNRRMAIVANGSTVQCVVYISDNFNGRAGATPSSTLAAGVWSAIYVRYDSSLGGDPNLAIYVNNNTPQTLNYTNDGAGGTMTLLRVADGSAAFGGGTDSDTPTSAIANGGQLGPNFFILNDNLTPAQITFLMAFEAPT